METLLPIDKLKSQEKPPGKIAIYKGVAVGLNPNAHCYYLIPPFENHSFIVISRVETPDHGDETMIFPANSNCEITDWDEIHVCRPGKQGESMLYLLGYKLVS